MENWKRVTQNRWVLHIAEGYELEFMIPPYQSCQPVTRASGNQAAHLQEEVNVLVTGADPRRGKGGPCPPFGTEQAQKAEVYHALSTCSYSDAAHISL